MNIHRKFILCLLILTAAFPAFASEYVSGDVLVVLRPSDSSAGVSVSSLSGFGRDSVRTASFAAASGAYVKEVYPALSEAGNCIYTLLHSETKSPEEFTQELLNDPEVIAASPNYIVSIASATNDTYIDSCWGLDYINAPSAWNTSTGSDSVYVAIIDTGIDYTNPDLTDNISTAYNAYLPKFSSPQDDQGHGTHVAGTIGALGNNGIGIAGVCWNVKMIAIKVLNSSGRGSISDVITGMNYVTELIQEGVNIRAVNMSLEFYSPLKPTHDNLVQMPIWRAFKDMDVLNKAVIVVAAGNYAVKIGEPTTRTTVMFSPGEYVYPASFQGLDNMISVSAVDSSGNLASFSNTGADISAPGVNILSTWLQSRSSTVREDGTSLYSESGTSMAVPYISGAIALMSSVMPTRTAYQLKRALLDGSNVSAASGQVSTSASGILDIKAALDYQAENTDLPKESTEWTNYDDYADYTTDSSYNYKSSGENDDDSEDDSGGATLRDGVYFLQHCFCS